MGNPFHSGSSAEDVWNSKPSQLNRADSISRVWDEEFKRQLSAAKNVNEWNAIMTKWNVIADERNSKVKTMHDQNAEGMKAPGRKGTILTGDMQDLGGASNSLFKGLF